MKKYECIFIVNGKKYVDILEHNEQLNLFGSGKELAATILANKYGLKKEEVLHGLGVREVYEKKVSSKEVVNKSNPDNTSDNSEWKQKQKEYKQFKADQKRQEQDEQERIETQNRKAKAATLRQEGKNFQAFFVEHGFKVLVGVLIVAMIIFITPRLINGSGENKTETHGNSSPNQEADTKTCNPTGDNVNVRTKPDVKSDVSFQLDKNQTFELLSEEKSDVIKGNSGKWYKIKFENKEGYIFSFYTNCK